MLQVIGAGLPRTGTTSTKAALDRLGFGPCYHMYEVMANPHLADRWLPVTEGSPADWEWIFDGYRSAQDWPSSHFWRELAEAYPEAKVILTVRDPRQWYVSIRTLFANGPGRAERERLPEAVRPVFAALERLRPLFEEIGRATFGPDWRFGQDTPDQDRFIAAYHRRIAQVRRTIPADRLLVFDVRQGWGPLCAFLGVEPPAGEPFPHLNDTESMRRAFDLMVTEGRLVSPLDVGRR